MIILDDAVVLPGETEVHRNLRIYMAEPGDGWTGFICAERGWDGTGTLPAVPATTHRTAKILWQRQVSRWGMELI